MLSQFIKENRKSFPNYFRAKELKNHHKKKELYYLYFENVVVGFYVLEKEKFKSLFIKKDYRKYSSQILKEMFTKIKNENKLLTIAINPNSSRMKRLAIKNNFVETKKIVQGKTHRLVIYKWKA